MYSEARVLPLVLLLAAAAAAQLPTPKEALALAFPGADMQRQTVTLDAVQQQRLGEVLGSRWDAAVVFVYEARRKGKLLGSAIFDTHRVRGQRETVLIAADATGKVQRVEVVAFGEPERYRPDAQFYRQFDGRTLGGDKDHEVAKVTPVAGATLTVHATIAAVQRALALFAELRTPPPEAPKPDHKPEPQPAQKPSSRQTGHSK